VTDVLDDAIRSFLIELVDATPPPPEFDEITTESWSLSHNTTTGRQWSKQRSGLVAAAVAGAFVLAIGLAISAIDVGGTHSHMPATNSSSQSNGYYKATTRLGVDLAQRADQSSVGIQKLPLAQLEVLAITGEVPDGVAAQLGTASGHQLAKRITITTNRRTSTLAITAVARTPKKATQLADAFSAELVRVVDERSQGAYAGARDNLQARLQSLQATGDALLAQLAVVPRIPNFDNVKAQYDATVNQYRISYDSYSQLVTQGPPTSAFTTLGDAQPVRITETEYDKRRHES
jgi:hypothetical protein